jgi:glycosyltransferase involved in cell wall biosynthesis
MRIAILSQYYPPEVGAAQNRVSALARLLAERGHAVQVLTALPHYPRRKIFPAYRRRLPMRETIDGVEVHRLGLHLPSRHTSLRRMLHYSSFALNALLLGGRVLTPADYLIIESPPLHLVPAGALLARRLGAKLVLNVSDLWPASALQTGFIQPGLATRLAVRFEEWCYRQAALITAQSEGTVEDIAARLPNKPVSLYPHGVDLKQWSNMPARAVARRAMGWSEHSFIAGYVGLHDPAHALHQVILAAQHLRDDPRIQIVLFGDGPQKHWLEARAKQLDVVNVRFHPEEPLHRLPTILAGLDVGLATLAAGKIFEGVRTSKMLEIMAAGRPVVLAARGESARLFGEAQAGIVVPPDEPEGLSIAIRELLRDPERRAQLGENGRRYVEQHFDNERIVGAIENLLQARLGR